MSKTQKKLKSILAEIEGLASKLESAGFAAQAEELDTAAETVEGLMQDFEGL